ncbi:T-complex 10 C-terminal domain-containing protein, partial [Mycolicibacterium iranicum]|uniref:T-complex 10 C-terminal domain-containing protein n=1 Tax=Mycolicibacterium iranicum TaxID=912594 RepID=UPI001F2638BA
SNLACLCREHHLLKTFWPGWSSVQYPDGTIIWTDPDGCTATTYPGSQALFPELCAPTAEVAATASPRKHIEGLTMPKRTITRAEARKQRVDDERRRNAENLSR